MGAGFTGLWTALYLARADPSLRITVLEAQTAGFGASGRNGGWCSALFPASLESLAARSSRSDALAQHAAMRHSVDEVMQSAAAEGIDAHMAKGGTISLARSRPQLARAESEVRDARRWGRGEDELRLLDAAEATAVLAGTRVRGATYTPDCAAIHPGRLVRGLADAVVRRGVALYEQTPATAITPGQVTTQHGIVRAERVIRATEGYTRTLDGERRRLVPVYSLIIATEPLSESVWEQIGLRRRETFSDHRHLIIYGQRTADDRLVFGGRGAPYHFGSRIRTAYDRNERVFASLHATLVDLFPVLKDDPRDPCVGRRPRHRPRLDGVRRPRPGHRPRLGRRLRRRRRQHHQPGRPHPGRPRARPRHGAHPAALGRPPLAVLGAGAPALAGDQRRAAGDDLGRPGGGPDRAGRAGSRSWSRR